VFKFSILLQSLNPSKQRYAAPYDSTQGVGPGFYWFSLIVVIFLALLIFKAFWDDREWRGKYFPFTVKEDKKIKDPV
jgi:hypothetical protein